ncbi:MAG: nitroreductase [Polaromonas sp.]|nr:nitroreductase [Polaromonas sp.]
MAKSSSSLSTHADSFASLIAQRRSIRAYQTKPVADSLLQDVLTLARQAPSGANLQPGSLISVVGEARQRLTADLTEGWRSGAQEPEDYSYFPTPLPMSLRRRQVAAAKALYGSIGIAQEDRAGRDLQFEQNFRFFDAPVALIATINGDFGSGGYMDFGMTLYGLMLAAQSHGLATCAIGAMASYPGLIRRNLGLDENSKIVCGIALGYADADAAVNQTVTERCALEQYFRVIE